jgi:hypothetical protein
MQKKPRERAKVKTGLEPQAVVEREMGQHQDGPAVRQREGSNRVLPSNQASEFQNAKASGRQKPGCQLQAQGHGHASETRVTMALLQV